MKPTRRVRFKVSQAQAAHDRLWLLSQGISAREWIEIQLTYLCAPHAEHPEDQTLTRAVHGAYPPPLPLPS